MRISIVNNKFVTPDQIVTCNEDDSIVVFLDDSHQVCSPRELFELLKSLRAKKVEVPDPPQDGWWPDETNAPMTQMLFKNGAGIANIIKQGNDGWRAFSCIEANKSGTTGKPLSAVTTREEAKAQCEAYAQSQTRTITVLKVG